MTEEAYIRDRWGGWIVYKAYNGQPGYGWKLHISTTTKEAQEALIDLVKKYGVSIFKYRDNPRDLQVLVDANGEAEKQHGKTFVVYHTKLGVKGQPIDWEKFIEEADAIVEKHGGTGLPVRGDRKIPGTVSVYYRYDLDKFGYYRSREQSTQDARHGGARLFTRYCPLRESEEPFESIRIGDAKQCSQGQLDFLHAVYSGDSGVVSTMLKANPDLACSVDPASKVPAWEIAKAMAIIEKILATTGAEIFPQVYEIPKLLAPEAYIQNKADHQQVWKNGRKVLMQTETDEEAKLLQSYLAEHRLFKRMKLEGNGKVGIGVLIPGGAV